MSIVNSFTVVDDHMQADGMKWVEHHFVDHLGKELVLGRKKVPGTDTEVQYSADRLLLETKVLSILAEREIEDAIDDAFKGINPDRVPDHQTQAEYDRRVLGRAMLIDNAHVFYAIYPMFQAVALRGGANTNQRATYLGVASANYGLIETRFNNVAGVAWFLTDEKAQIWQDLPGEFS